MGWARSAYGGGERRMKDSGGENWEKETIWEISSRWEDNIKMDLQEVGRGSMDWIDMAQDRDRWRALVSAIINWRVPLNAWNFLSSFTLLSHVVESRGLATLTFYFSTGCEVVFSIKLRSLYPLKITLPPTEQEVVWRNNLLPLLSFEHRTILPVPSSNILVSNSVKRFSFYIQQQVTLDSDFQENASGKSEASSSLLTAGLLEMCKVTFALIFTRISAWAKLKVLH